MSEEEAGGAGQEDAGSGGEQAGGQQSSGSNGLDVGGAIKYGVKRPLEKDGLMVLGLIWAVALLNEIAEQSAAEGLVSGFAMRGIEQARRETPGASQELQMVEDFIMDATVMPLALVPSSVAIPLGILASILMITAYIVGYRTFVNPGSDSLPSESTSNLLMTTVHGFIGSIVVSILVAIGLILLIIPGIFLMISFAFYLAYIALHDVSFIEGMKRSWGLTSGNRFGIFLFGVGLVFVFIGLWIVGGIASFVVGIGGALPGELVSVAFGAYGSAIVVGGLAHAYIQLEEGRQL